MFKYARPTSVDEASGLLAQSSEVARPLLGGTDLFVGLRKGKLSADLVVDLKGIAELAPDIDGSGNTTVVSAGTVMTDVTDDEGCRRRFPALVEAAAAVGSIQIRNRASLAGNICNASPAADAVLPLLAHRASVVVGRAGGWRRLALSEFFLGPGQTVLENGEIVTAVEVPRPAAGTGSAFARMTRRRGVDLATVNLCCVAEPGGPVRFAVGAAGPRPFVVCDEDGVLAERAADEVEVATAIGDLMSAATPISDIRGSREYRRAMLAVLATRTLRQAWERAGREAAT